jgi:hypothetical protein
MENVAWQRYTGAAAWPVADRIGTGLTVENGMPSVLASAIAIVEKCVPVSKTKGNGTNVP